MDYTTRTVESDEAYFLLVVDGCSRRSAGLYLEEAAGLSKSLGMIDAINLDGGASSTFVFKGKRLNTPRMSLVGFSRYLSIPYPLGERRVPTTLTLSYRDVPRDPGA